MSQVIGVLVCMNIPYPRLLMKNGTGLYISGFSTLYGSLAQSTTFWPRLLKSVNDSPQPNSFSAGESDQTAATLRDRSLERLTNRNGWLPS